MNAKAKAVLAILNYAEQHGMDDNDLAHEVGDLQLALELAMQMLSDQQAQGLVAKLRGEYDWDLPKEED